MAPDDDGIDLLLVVETSEQGLNACKFLMTLPELKSCVSHAFGKASAGMPKPCAGGLVV